MTHQHPARLCCWLIVEIINLVLISFSPLMKIWRFLFLSFSSGSDVNVWVCNDQYLAGWPLMWLAGLWPKLWHCNFLRKCLNVKTLHDRIDGTTTRHCVSNTCLYFFQFRDLALYQGHSRVKQFCLRISCSFQSFSVQWQHGIYLSHSLSKVFPSLFPVLNVSYLSICSCL